MGTFKRATNGQEHTYLDQPYWRVSFRVQDGETYTFWAQSREERVIKGQSFIRYIECTREGGTFDNQIRIAMCGVDDVIRERTAWLNLHYGELEIFRREPPQIAQEA